MKRLFSAVGLFAVAALASSYGQTPIAAAAIPFDFHAGQTLLPAGDYVIKQSSDILTIRGAAGKPTVMMLTLPASRSGTSPKARLQFQRYGNDYFLSKIWAANSSDGLALPKCKQEQELASRRPLQNIKEVTLQATNRPDHAVR